MAIPITGYPFDNQSVPEDGWRAMQRRTNVSGVVRNQANEMRTFGDSTGMQVKVDTGECWIESYWGGTTAITPLSINSNVSGSLRYDVAIARADWTNNVVNLDILQGTPGSTPPAPTRNSSLWEIPLAVVKVANGAVTINPADVLDARQWAGPPVSTGPDDFLLFGDRISTCSRFNVSATNALINTNLYVSRMHNLGEPTCSTIRLLPSTLPVAGTTQVRIFKGPRMDQLNTVIDPTTSTFLYGGSADTIHSSAIPQTTFRAGEAIVVAVLGLSTTTAAQLVTNAVVWSGGNPSAFLNPSTTTTMTTAFKTAASMPSTLNLLDGSWTIRDRVFWAALA